MGAWGFKFYENDDATDWLADFGEAPAWPLVFTALQVDQTGYVEAPEACCAIASAELVAAANHHPSPALDQSLARWAAADVNAPAGQQMAGLAAGIVQYLAHHGELAELWQEGDDAEWQAEMSDLQKRLTR